MLLSLSPVNLLYREARPLVACLLSKRFREFPVLFSLDISFSHSLINELAINMTWRTPLRRRDYHFPVARDAYRRSDSAFSHFFFLSLSLDICECRQPLFLGVQDVLDVDDRVVSATSGNI